MQKALACQRGLITQATEFMGPALCRVFAEQGADVVASTEALSAPDAPARVVAAAGRFDVLVANLAHRAPTTPAAAVGDDDEWREVFAALEDPLRRRVRAATPAMVEFAPHQVQIHAIAQNFVDNPTDFPPEVQANPRFQERLAREVPLGRLVTPQEDASFAAYLCSPAADCFVGPVFPLCGGWVLR